MTDESYTVPVEGEPSGSHEIPVSFEDVEIKRVPVAHDPLAGLPLSVKEEALKAKIAALDAGKTMAEAAKAERYVVNAWKWSVRAARAAMFFKWCAIAAILCCAYFLAAHDWLDPKYRPAREAKERSVKVAQAQYKFDVAKVELQEAKTNYVHPHHPREGRSRRVH